jgi:2-hydroxy-3-keto-5-methylthiopentenyl-1-phosphate phosphatase
MGEMSISPKKPFIFLDFDGTITSADAIIAIMESFGPKGWEKLKQQTLSREISVREGVGAMFSLIPSRQKEKIISFVKKNIKIREGFPDFLGFCKKEKIEYRVISGGLDFYIDPLLKKFVSQENILCNGSDFSSKAIEVVWEYPCDPYCHLDCGFCKLSLIRTCDPGIYRRILVGDSVTDFGAASIADLVIARDTLLEHCQGTGIPVRPFNDFFEVIEAIKQGSD